MKTNKKDKRGRPPALGQGVFVRLPDDLRAKIQALVELDQIKQPMRTVSLSDVTRELIFEGLAAREQVTKTGE